MLNALKLVLMKFGFEADTLDAVWIYYRGKYLYNWLWIFLGFIFALSMPILIILFFQTDNRYLLFIPDVYFNILGWLATYAAIFWKFNKSTCNLTLTKSAINDLKLTSVDRPKFIICMLGYESLIITLNLLPFTLGYFICRFLIIASGALGFYNVPELTFSFLWILVYQVIIFLWIYLLRVLWIILQNTHLKASWIGAIYSVIIILLICLSSLNNISKTLIWFIRCLENVNINKGLSNIFSELISHLSDVNVKTVLSVLIIITIFCSNVVLLKYRLEKSKSSRAIYLRSFSTMVMLYFGILVLTLFYDPFKALVSLLNEIVFLFISSIPSAISISFLQLNLLTAYNFGNSMNQSVDYKFFYYDIFLYNLSSDSSTHNLTLLPKPMTFLMASLMIKKMNPLFNLIIDPFTQVFYILGPLVACHFLNKILTFQLKEVRRNQ